MSEYLVWAVVHLGSWLLMLLASAGAGHLFLRKYQFDSRVERLVFTLALGLGLTSLLIFGLGIIGLLYREILLGLTLAGALGTVVHLLRLRRIGPVIRRPLWGERYSVRGVAIVFLTAVGLAYWLVLLLSTQYPPTHWDAISHHLVLCREYLAHHRMVIVEGIPHPVLPALNHMLFTWALALQDDILAQMMEHTFLMLTALGLYSWGKREKSPLFGIAVAAFWLGQPLVLWLGEAAYVDICLVCFVFLGIYALRLFWETREARWWFLSMALLGIGAGVKLSGLFFTIAGGMLGLWVIARSHIRWRLPLQTAGKVELETSKRAQARFTWNSLVVGWGIAFIFLIPWYAFIFYHTGNPIWPTFPELSRGVWGSPAVVASANNWLTNAAEPRTLKNFLLLPLDWIRYPATFYAELNLSLFPLIVIWPIAWIAALWNRSVRWWTLWAFSFTVYWFLFPHQLRYWLPALPLAGLALYETIRWMLEKMSRSEVLRTALWVVLTLSAVIYAGRELKEKLEYRRWPPVNQEAREAFLSGMGGYKAVKYINRQAREEEIICVINSSWLNYYLKPQVIDVFGLLQANRLPEFHWPEDTQWVRWLESRGVTWILVDHGNAPGYLKAPKHNIVLNPIWPDFELVYADPVNWVFRHKGADQNSSNKAANQNNSNKPTEPLPVYEGYHDITNCNGIMGWAWDKNQPDQPVKIDIYDGDKLLETVTADNFRQDLVNAGIGNGQHSFTYPVPPGLKDGKPHSIRMKFAGTNIDLIHTPKQITCELEQ
jgi:dolichyl-phosphate-mannose-protein mannosyltransferase